MTNQTPQQKALDDLDKLAHFIEHGCGARLEDKHDSLQIIETIRQALQSAPEEIQVKDAYGISLLSSEDITDFILQYPNGIRIVKNKGEL